MTNPRALAAPADPYRPGDDRAVAPRPGAARRAAGRGDAVAAAAGDRHVAARRAGAGARAPARARWRAAAFFNFELHGIDFADAEQDGIPGELVARQPDLRVPIADKLARLERLLDTARARAGTFATLAEVATEAQRST